MRKMNAYVTFDGECRNFVVEFSATEANTLAWLADRYVTAGILWVCSEPVFDDLNGVDTDEYRLQLSERRGSEYLAELARENGDPGQVIPTCAGGPLATKLRALWEAITELSPV